MTPCRLREPCSAGRLVLPASVLAVALLLALGSPPGLAHAVTTVRPAVDFFDPWYDPVEFPPTELTAPLRACLPARLHPVSRQFLDLWLAGRIGTRTFRRFFHMPNSAYLPVAECLVRVRTGLAAARHGAST